jgi:hypothetical protein
MEMPTVANPDMAVHLIVDDEQSALGQRGSRFFSRMLVYHALVVVLSTLLTAAPVNYAAVEAAPPAAAAPATSLQKSHCTDIQVSEDCADGRADPICEDIDGCMPCSVDSASTCVRYEDIDFCDDFGGYGYGYSVGGGNQSMIIHMDMIYMPLIGLLGIVITGLGVVGSFRRSRNLFALHAVLLPALGLTCVICAVVSALMGIGESDDCENRPAGGNRDNICARVAPYYASVALFLLLGMRN